MRYSKIKLAVLTVALFTTIFVSCNRDNKSSTEKDTDTEYASDRALGEISFNDVQSIEDDASNKGNGATLDNYKTSSNCATITHDSISIPHTITVDFGSTNCLCGDNRLRRGKIICSYTGQYRDSGSVRSTTFDNYFVNNNQILGTKTVTNMGHNGQGQSYFTINVAAQIIKANNAGTITWNSNRTRTWIAGESTAIKLDDEYSITGSGSGTKANGNTYTVTITTPLIKALNCNWIKQGVMDITPSNKPVRSINFGTGTCDNQAVVTINGTNYNITLN
jgi:hypothetical protein